MAPHSQRFQSSHAMVAKRSIDHPAPCFACPSTAAGNRRRSQAAKERIPDRSEMVYRSGDRMMSVRLSVTPAGPVLSPPVALFAGRAAYGGGLTIANFSVASDRSEEHTSEL